MQKLVNVPNYMELTQTPLGVGVATLKATDPQNSITDTVSYELRIHLPAEKEEPTEVFTGWLHETPEPFAQIRNYYAPIGLHAPIENWSSVPVQYTYSYQYSTTWYVGWKYTAQAQLTLGAELAKVVFGNEQELNTETEWSTSSEVKISVTVPPYKRFILWAITSGSVVDWLTSRWERHGFALDTNEAVTRDTIMIDVVQIEDVGTPIRWPSSSSR